MNYSVDPDGKKIADALEKFDCFRLSEDGYKKAMNDSILPYLESIVSEEQLKLSDGAEIHIAEYKNPDVNVKGHVLIVHGFTEAAVKYKELIYYLIEFGYSVTAFDQRGHGRSTRDVKEPSLTHIDRFETYVSELDEIVRIRFSECKLPLYLFAHSMGGAVSAMYLETHPDHPFKKAVFSSPMIAPDRGGFPMWVSKAMVRFFILFGQGKKRIFLSRPPEGREDFETAASNCLARFDYYQDIKTSMPEYSNNGPTYKWTLESLKVTKKLMKKGMPEKIGIPVLFFIADGDRSVLTGAINEFAKRLPDATVKEIKECRHEIYFGPDSILRDYFSTIEAFLN